MGKAYFTEQVRVSGGDLAKAYAAYNAGPGGLRKAIKAATAWNQEHPGAEKSYRAFLPAETQTYIGCSPLPEGWQRPAH